MKARLLAVAFATMVAACGSVAGPGSDPSPTPESSVTVTKADNQQTVTAHVGDHVQIALGEDINWQLEPPDGRVLVQEPNRNYMLVRGTQAIWLARSAGRSTIKASGGMNCPSGSLCPMFLAVFSVTVEVSP
ncbi:MAG: hypothetical protein AABM40_01930 [Chloroflexota bacterium]